MNLGDLTVSLQFTAQGLESGIDAAKESLNDLTGVVESLDQVLESSGGSAGKSVKTNAQTIDQSNQAAAASFAVISAAAAAAFAKIAGAVSAGVQAFTAYQGAVNGLKSVASHNDIGQSEIGSALDQLTDKFMNTTAASTALKNLLSRGYTLDQAVQTITRLKDAAAFGRQSQYELADAVVTATEGLKNENSILVDNAGVTKNVAKMWEDYAKTIGVSVQSLTQGQKILAEYNGIAAETVAQTGDLAKMSEGLAGAQAESANSVQLLAQGYGEAIAPTVTFVETLKSGVANTLRDIVEAAPEAAAGLTATGIAVTGLVAVTKAVQGFMALNDALKKSGTAFTLFGKSVSLSMGWIAGIGLAVGVIAGVYTAIARGAEEAKKKQEELRTSISESTKKASDLKELADRYDELKNKTGKSLSAMKEMESIQNTLANDYGVVAGAVDGLAGSYWNLVDAANAAAEAQLKSAAGDAYNLHASKLKQLKEKIDELKLSNSELDGEGNLILGVPYEELIGQNQGIQKMWTDTVASAMDATIAELNAGGVEIDKTTAMIGKNMMLNISENAVPELGQMDTALQGYKDLISDFVQNSGLEDAKGEIDGFMGKVFGGDAISDKDLANFHDQGRKIVEIADDMRKKVFDTTGDQEKADAAANAILMPFAEKARQMFSENGEIFSAEQFLGMFEGAEVPASAMESIKKYQELLKDETTETLKTNTAALNAKKEELEHVGEQYEKNIQAEKESAIALETLNKLNELKGDSTNWNERSEEFKKYADAFKEGTGIAIESYEDLEEMTEKYATANEINKEILGDSKEAFEGLYEVLSTVYDTMEDGEDKNQLGKLLFETAQGIREVNDEVPKLSTSLNNLKEGVSSVQTAFDPFNATVEESIKYSEEMGEEVKDTTAELKKYETMVSKATSLKNLAKEFRNNKISAADFQAEVKKLGFANIKTADEADALADRLGQDLYSSLETTKSQLLDTLYNLEAAQAASVVNGEITVNNSGAIAAIQATINLVTFLLSLLGQAGLGTGPSGGGGGGGKKESAYQNAIDALEHGKKMDAVSLQEELSRLLAIQENFHDLEEKEARDLAERIHEVQKKMHEEALDAAYENIEHKKAMGEIDLEQEIALLEKIGKEHQLSVEERMKLDEQLYSAREQLRQEKEDKLSGVGEGLVEALRNQYEDMKEAELKALDESQEAIEKWSEERIKAIEAQIEAIDKLSAREDDEAKDAKERKKIAKLQESINFEQDEYNRLQLQAQLEKAQEERAERLRKKERDDQKQALKDQIDGIKNEKDEKLQDIEDQKAKIDEIYAKLLEQTSLEAEARRKLLQESQEEIVAFIGKFAPEYDALGKSLGEKWLTGFESVVGNVANYFDSFNTKLQKIQENLAAQALQVVDNFRNGKRNNQSAIESYRPVVEERRIEQTFNFNQTIESPAQVAKRVRRVAEDMVYV